MSDVTCSGGGATVTCLGGVPFRSWVNRVSIVRRALVGAFLGTLTLPVGVAAASAPAATLRVVAAYNVSSQTNVVVSVPRQLARLALPRSSFTVSQAGQPLSASVERVSGAGLSVYIVLDTTAANTALVAEQSAAADLLRQFPDAVRTAVATSADDVAAAEPGNAAALRTLAAVKRDSTMVVEKTLNQIVTASSNDERRLIVLMTSCPTDSEVDISPLKAALDRGTSQLDIVGLGSACPSRLMALTRDRGGVIGMLAAASQLAAAVDDITYDTLGQYRISVQALARAKPLTIAVSFAGTKATSEVRLPTRGVGALKLAPSESTPASSAAGTARRHSLPSWFPVAAVGGLTGLALVACAVAALQSKARRRRDPRPTPASRPTPTPTWPSPRGPGDSDHSGQTLADAIAQARGQARQGMERARLSQTRVDPPAPAERLVRAEPEAAAARVPTQAAAPELEPVANAARVEREMGEGAGPAATTRSAPAAEPWPVAGIVASGPEEDSEAPRNRRLALPASGLTDGTVRVRLPLREDVAHIQVFAQSEGGLADDWVPLPEDASTVACQALVDSWLRDWNNELAATDLVLVIERTSQNGMIGFIGLRLDSEAVNVTYGIAPPYRGRGYAKRALRSVANWLAQHEHVIQIVANIAMRNQAGRAVARAVGFVPTSLHVFDVTAKPMIPNVLFVFEPGATDEQTDPRRTAG